MGLAHADSGIVDVSDGTASRLTLSHEDFGVTIALDLVAPELRLQQKRMARVVGKRAGHDEVAGLSGGEIPQRLHHFVGHSTTLAVLKFSVDR